MRFSVCEKIIQHIMVYTLKKLALISVSDKTNIKEFAGELDSLGYEILATGNTAKLLTESGIGCTEISSFASFPEIFEGRVKTLQPRVFGGILMRRDIEQDIREAEENNILPIDIVCVNLYPFPQVVKREDLDLATKIENIDIGGPSLIRASAKNYKFVSVLTDPSQYDGFLSELKSSGQTSVETRQRLAKDAFSYTSYYDTLIANFLEKEFNCPSDSIRINQKLVQGLRYGENPHQAAGVYGDFFDYFEILHGKEISYNNIVDLVAAVELINDLGENSCAIIKHTNACGAAEGSSSLEAYSKALSCDPVSAFGGIVAFSSEVDAKTAEKLNEIFLEIVYAPSFTAEALQILEKKKNRRLVKGIKELPRNYMTVKTIPGGLIAQERDNSVLTDDLLKTVTKRGVTTAELEDLRFAWVISKHTKSNAIVFAKNRMILGVGAGQTSRVDSVKIAIQKAKEHGHDLQGSVAASDAYFPFPDGVQEIAAAGSAAIIQPGGSVRDEEAISTANENNVAMIFTSIRNFKH